jgi:hypothetical protein
VGESLRDPQLEEVVLGEFVSNPGAEGRARPSDVDGDVVDGTPGGSDELALGCGRQLVVEAPQHPSHRPGVVVLDEGPLVEGLVEQAAFVGEDPWMDEVEASEK